MIGAYVSLLHTPVFDRNQQIITASVTNLDLHDIARSCKTYGVKKYFVVHPSPDEQALNSRIMNHWKSGYGQLSHPTRTDAFELVRLVPTFEEVVKEIELEEKARPYLVGTSAKNQGPKSVTIGDLKAKQKERF